MRLNKRSISRLLVLVLICCFCTSFVRQDNANAYFHTNQSKTAQCFSILYKQDKSDSNVTYHSQGEKVTTGETFGGVWSTNKICAYIDNNGKVTGGLTYSGKRPPGTSAISGYPKLSLSKDKKGIIIHYCSKGGNKCKPDFNADSPVRQDSPAWETDNPTNNTVLTEEFKVDKYDTFYNLAKAVNDFAQNKYLDATKLALDENTTTDEVIGWDNNTSTETRNENCRNGGAKSLGWIICPILEWAGDSAQTVYNDYIEPALNIDARLFNEDENGGAMQQAWGTFRDIANIIFVILLLAVIISQLTGVGIDNYGIKKILPKLIVVAVLVNLSYFLCILAVDVSNILGNSFQALFDGLGQSLAPTTLEITDAKFSGDSAEIASTAGSIAGLSVLGALVGMTGSIWATPAVIMSLLVGAIGVVVAIFFLFILLSAREAAIIVLITIAPMAIVLYALPNTKKIFDKWLNLFKGLLLVYPIAGLLVGGGDYVSALLLNVGGGDTFFNALTAMVVGVLPIFFIPTVLRSAFAAMGNLGAKISGFGQRIGSGATRAARSSSMYQGLQDRAGKFAVKQRAEMGKKYALKDGGYARFRRGMLGGTRGIAADLAMSKKAEADEVGNYMTFINDRTRNGEDEKELENIYEDL